MMLSAVFIFSLRPQAPGRRVSLGKDNAPPSEEENCVFALHQVLEGFVMVIIVYFRIGLAATAIVAQALAPFVDTLLGGSQSAGGGKDHVVQLTSKDDIGATGTTIDMV